MDAGTIITRLLPQLHAVDEASLVATSRAELLEMIDEVLKKIAKSALFFVFRDTSISTANGTATYSVTSKHLATLRVSLANNPLIDSTSNELEMLDEGYKTTNTTPPAHWYGDGDGLSKIGLYPVPTSAATLAVIQQEMPAEIVDPGALTVQMPAVFDDLVQIEVLRETYTKESDIAMPELAAPLDKLIDTYMGAISELYGRGQ